MVAVTSDERHDLYDNIFGIVLFFLKFINFEFSKTDFFRRVDKIIWMNNLKFFQIVSPNLRNFVPHFDFQKGQIFLIFLLFDFFVEKC